MLRRLLVFLIAAAALPACGSSTPTGPSTPTPNAPAISCPADVATESDVTPAPVTYPTPTISGGSAPLTQQCSLASGALFPIGTSNVNCTATDSLQRTSQCSFRVTVTLVPRLLGTKFLAFGDSITHGETRDPLTNQSPAFQDDVNNYVRVLEGLLVARYKRQTITMIKEGAGGEKVGQGEPRLINLLDTHHPDALLLMEGYNDANQGTAADTVGQGLRADIVRAYQRGVKKVFLATLAPPSACKPGIQCNAPRADDVDAINDAIRFAATRENAVLVDVWAALNPVKAQAIGEDGLHPTVLGHRLIAETFMAAIVANFEEPPPAAATQQLLSRPPAQGPVSSSAARPRGWR